MVNFKRKSDIITVQPATELWSVAEVKAYLKIESYNKDEDAIIISYLKSAREFAEKYTNRAFITQTRKLTLDAIDAVYPEDRLSAGVYELPYNYFMGGSDYIEFPNKPLASVTSFTYYDVTDTSAVWSSSNYNLDTASGRLYLKNGVSFPVTLRNRNAIEIVYVCGYGTKNDVPASIRNAVLMLTGQMYETRGLCEMTCDCQKLLDTYVVYGDSLC